MRNLGLLLLFGAFVVGAYLTALDPLEIQWNWFLPVIGLGTLGLYLIRRDRHGTSRTAHVLAGNQSELSQSISAIVEKLDPIRSEFNPRNLEPVRQAIDKRLRGEINRFVQARESMIHLYGLQAYADVMSDFAAGERYLNRVWSASTDGYAGEVRTYLDKAADQFSRAKSRLESTNKLSGSSAVP